MRSKNITKDQRKQQQQFVKQQQHHHIARAHKRFLSRNTQLKQQKRTIFASNRGDSPDNQEPRGDHQQATRSLLERRDGVEEEIDPGDLSRGGLLGVVGGEPPGDGAGPVVGLYRRHQKREGHQLRRALHFPPAPISELSSDLPLLSAYQHIILSFILRTFLFADKNSKKKKKPLNFVNFTRFFKFTHLPHTIL